MTGPQVKITGSIVTAESYSDASGTRAILDAIGEWRFFADSVEADSGRICMWSEPPFVAAIIEAEGIGAEYGELVVDLLMAGRT